MLDVTATEPRSVAAPDPAGRPAGSATPFVHVEAGRIVDGHGNPLLLRGVGLGNWLLPEGYMWGFPSTTSSPRQIEELLTTLLGAQGAATFWAEFRSRFIAEADIARIATEGFDHVRLPVNWRVLMTADGTWIEDGFACIDRLITWCRSHGLTVLLDLHGAPGGQTGTNIDDSLGRPELFMDQRNIDLTIALWTQIAHRYRDEPTVLGYDLLNEPLPDEWQHRYADELVTLYRQLTEAIRVVDPDHLIMYEGMHWATNWDIFTEVWDPNSVLQFHKYWSPADRPSIQGFVDVGRDLGLPVYMGEGGENTPEWLAAAFQLYEDSGIGWNFWPWKKLDTQSSPCSITPPRGWDAVVRCASGDGAAPSRADAVRIFGELLAAMDLEACTYREPVVNALFRRAPLRLPAYAFTFHGPGASYAASGARADPGLRPDDAVALRRRDRKAEADFHYPPVEGDEATIVADLQPGEWLAFDVELPAGRWTMTVVTDRALGAGDGAGPTTADADGPALTLDDVAVPMERAGPMEHTASTFGQLSRSGSVLRTSPGRVQLRVLAQAAPITVVALDVTRAAS